MNTAVNMGWCYRSSVYVVTSGGVNTAERELQLFFQGVDVNEVTALYHSTFNVTGRAMRNGEVRLIASVCEREIVGGLQFVRKLHFPLFPSSSFPPDYPLYLTNLVIHPLSAVLSPNLSWPDIRHLMQLSDLENILSVGRICYQLGESYLNVFLLHTMENLLSVYIFYQYWRIFYQFGESVISWENPTSMCFCYMI